MRWGTLLFILCSSLFQTEAQQVSAAVRTACAADAQRLCGGVQSGGGRIVACLKQNQDSLSDACRQAAGLPRKVGSSAPSNENLSLPAPAPASAPAPSTPPRPSSPTAASKTNAPKSSVPAGDKEIFAERVIPDAGHQNMRAVTIHLPEKWTYEGKIVWHYNWIENSMEYSLHAENPANSEAFFQYPLMRMENLEVSQQYRQFNRGNRVAPGERMPLGAISMAPIPHLNALAKFIQTTRPNVANFKWIGQQDLPGLAKAINVDPGWPNQHGVAIKVSYDLDGKPVEEAFFGVYYIAKSSTPGQSIGQMTMTAGAIQQTNWGFVGLMSMRAPAGTLDKRMPMFCVIAKSVIVNPEWMKLSKAISDKMNAEFQQKLKQGLDQLHAAEAIRQQTMKDQATFQANFDKQEIAFRNDRGINDDFLRSDGSVNPNGGARSASDHWSDLMRGVDTMNDPSNGSTTEVSNVGGYNHFTDGFGNYRTYDNSNDTPENQGENGTWTRMTQAP